MASSNSAPALTRGKGVCPFETRGDAAARFFVFLFLFLFKGRRRRRRVRRRTRRRFRRRRRRRRRRGGGRRRRWPSGVAGLCGGRRVLPQGPKGPPGRHPRELLSAERREPLSFLLLLHLHLHLHLQLLLAPRPAAPANDPPPVRAAVPAAVPPAEIGGMALSCPRTRRRRRRRARG